MLIFVSKPPHFLFFWKCCSFKIDFVELALKGVLCIRLGSKGSVIYDFVPTANVTANKGETAVHGDMAVRIRWVQARSWDGMRVTCLQFVLLETMNL